MGRDLLEQTDFVLAAIRAQLPGAAEHYVKWFMGGAVNGAGLVRGSDLWTIAFYPEGQGPPKRGRGVVANARGVRTVMTGMEPERGWTSMGEAILAAFAEAPAGPSPIRRVQASLRYRPAGEAETLPPALDPLVALLGRPEGSSPSIRTPWSADESEIECEWTLQPGRPEAPLRAALDSLNLRPGLEANGLLVTESMAASWPASGLRWLHLTLRRW